MSGEISHVITCDELEGFLYAYLDGEFEPGDKLEFEQHLAQCSRCAHKVHSESIFRENLHQRAREQGARAPEGLRRNIHTQLRHEQQRAALRTWVRAGAAAAVIVAAGGAYIFIRPGVRGLYMAAGLSLNEVFMLHVESYYRRLERETLQGLLADGQGVVLAAGGGIVNDRETYRLLRRRAVTVWLKARPEDHWNRVLQQGDASLTFFRAEPKRMVSGE